MHLAGSPISCQTSNPKSAWCLYLLGWCRSTGRRGSRLVIVPPVAARRERISSRPQGFAYHTMVHPTLFPAILRLTRLDFVRAIHMLPMPYHHNDCDRYHRGPFARRKSLRAVEEKKRCTRFGCRIGKADTWPDGPRSGRGRRQAGSGRPGRRRTRSQIICDQFASIARHVRPIECAYRGGVYE